MNNINEYDEIFISSSNPINPSLVLTEEQLTEMCEEVERRKMPIGVGKIEAGFNRLQYALCGMKMEVITNEEKEVPKRNRQSFANIKGKRKRF